MAERNQPIPETAGASYSVEGSQPESPAPPRQRRWLNGLLLAVLTLAPAAAGAWVSYFYYPTLLQAATWFPGTNPDTKKDEPIRYGQFTELQGFIVNPAGTGGTRYLMVNIGLESSKAAVLEEIKEKEVVVRDIVLKLLSQRTVEELADISLRPQLKETLRDTINSVLHKGKIDRLYFTQYVLQ
jgi:flagellar FliL protein